MEIVEALGYLVSGIQLAQSKGVYTLEESEILSKAISTIFPIKEEEKIEENKN